MHIIVDGRERINVVKFFITYMMMQQFILRGNMILQRLIYKIERSLAAQSADILMNYKVVYKGRAIYP